MALSNVFAMMQMQNNDYHNGITTGGCYRPDRSPWGPRCPRNHPTWHQNLPDSPVGQHGWWCPHTTQGYGIDLNGNGRYDRGQDGVLAFDLDHDGRIEDREIQESNQRLKAFGGNYDLNDDGKVTFCERMKAERYAQEMQHLDANQDGALDANELARGGGSICIDQNRDGHVQPWEQHSPYSFPTPGFGRGSIGYVDPRCNDTRVDHWGRGGWRGV